MARLEASNIEALLAMVRQALTQARSLKWTFRDGETKSVLCEQEADEFWDACIDAPDALDAIASELENAEFETKRHRVMAEIAGAAADDEHARLDKAKEALQEIADKQDREWIENGRPEDGEVPPWQIPGTYSFIARDALGKIQ